MSLRRWSLVVLILLLGALVRGLHMTERSFWIDEGFSFFFAQSPDLVETLARDVHPPLYFAGLRLWSEIAGDSELALRWFSLLPSMCSLAFVYQMAIEAGRWRKSKWGGSALPLLAMLMLALADVETFMAREARQYTWLSLLVLVSMLCLARWLRWRRRRSLVGWAAASIMMLYTHYIAAFALAAQFLYILIWTRGKTRLRAIAALFLCALALAPWLIVIGWRQVENRGAHMAWAFDLTGALLHEIAVNYFTGQWALMLGLLALGCVTLVYRRDASVVLRFDPLTPLLLLWLIAPFCLTILINEALPFLQPHRLNQWTPAIALLIACGLGNIRQPIRAFLVAVIVVYGLTQVEFGRKQPDWRHIAGLTTRYAGAGDLILSDIASGDYPLAYYLRRKSGALPALDAGVRYEALQLQRAHQASTYEAWLPRLLDAQETVWLLYWSSDKSAFNWLTELNFKRTAHYPHRHDGGANGESLIHVYRYDRIPAPPPAAQFANGMILRAARLDQEDLRLDTLWETARPLEVDFLLSAKLLDASGVLVAQHDSQPQANQRPTSGWRVGELVYSPHEMTAHAPLAAGKYQVIAQVYTIEADGFRNVLTADGSEFAFVEEIQLEAQP